MSLSLLRLERLTKKPNCELHLNLSNAFLQWCTSEDDAWSIIHEVEANNKVKFKKKKQCDRGMITLVLTGTCL